MFRLALATAAIATAVQDQEEPGWTKIKTGSNVLAVDWNPNGNSVVSGGGDDLVRSWDIVTGENTWNGTGAVSVKYSPDGTRVVSTSGDDKSVRILDALTGESLLNLTGHTDFVNDVAYSPDGARVVSGSYDGTLRIWDALTGKSLLELKSDTDQVWSVAYSPDGTQVVSGSSTCCEPDSTWAEVLHIWDAMTGESLHRLKGHTRDIWSVAYSPDGKYVASAGRDKTHRIWDAMTGESLLNVTHHHHVYSVAYSPDGKNVVTGSHNVCVWNALTGEIVQKFEGYDEDVSSVAYSPDGRYILSSSWDSTIRISRTSDFSALPALTTLV